MSYERGSHWPLELTQSRGGGADYKKEVQPKREMFEKAVNDLFSSSSATQGKNSGFNRS